ncbi:MAG TPA: serine hydrolase domain-containing protein [Vicinamibacteria bacterium]|nr:serine hydrolase domain-containing protein [Vicinamibacteria bacterium]
MGLSSERLRRLTAVVKRYVDEGRVAGVVTLVARGGKLAHLEAAGQADREAGVPMRTDTIFRIASMSKAVTSVAAMMLVEEGRLGLADPVFRYIPSFKKTTVFVAAPAGAVPGTPVSVVPAKREITVRDLLTHTSGLSYGWGAAEPQYKAAGVLGWYFADKGEPIAAAIDRLPSLPFEAQPGEKYVYGFSTDVLGAVVEKASGLSLDEFFETRIFQPLGMSDTHFYLPPTKKSRLAAVYSARDGALVRAPDEGTGQGAYVDGPRQAFSGGAGLLSTARDYARLLQALLGGGELDGVRILGPKTVELMTSNHVGTLFSEARSGFGVGFGLGFEIVEHVGRAGRHGSVGEFGWGGAYYTGYWADPQEKLVAVFMAQLLPSGGLDLQGRFRTLVYQSIVAPPPLR